MALFQFRNERARFYAGLATGIMILVIWLFTILHCQSMWQQGFDACARTCITPLANLTIS